MSTSGGPTHRYTFRRSSNDKADNVKTRVGLKRAREVILESTDEDEYVPNKRQAKKKGTNDASSSLFFGGKIVIPKGVTRAAFFELTEVE